MVVRLGRSWCGSMRGNLGLDGLDEARAFLLALVDGLGEKIQLAIESPGAEEEKMEQVLPSLPEW